MYTYDGDAWLAIPVEAVTTKLPPLFAKQLPVIRPVRLMVRPLGNPDAV